MHAAFRQERRTSLLSASAALQEIGKAEDLVVVSLKENHSSRSLSGHSNCETGLEGETP
jgi:hypothetical protein